MNWTDQARNPELVAEKNHKPEIKSRAKISQRQKFDEGDPDVRKEKKKEKGNKYEEQRQNLKVSLYKTTLTRTIPRSD